MAQLLSPQRVAITLVDSHVIEIDEGCWHEETNQGVEIHSGKGKMFIPWHRVAAVNTLYAVIA